MLDEASPRIFTRLMKEQCWRRAPIVPGRDPERWRIDAVGNIVSYKLRGCEGCLCHEYDHILPYSKGGETSAENCQILQTRANRYKGNEANDPQKLVGYSCARSYSEAELDFIEIGLYGNINRAGLHCRVYSVYEALGAPAEKHTPHKQRALPRCPTNN